MITGSVELHLIAPVVSNLVLKKAVCIVEHLCDGCKEQYVNILLQVQLLTVVFHWYHKG